MELQSSVYKNSNFMRNSKYFWKLNILMVSIYLRKHFRRQCESVSEKFFHEAFNYKKYTKIIQNCPKMAIFNFCFIGRKILKQKRL